MSAKFVEDRSRKKYVSEATTIVDKYYESNVKCVTENNYDSEESLWFRIPKRLSVMYLYIYAQLAQDKDIIREDSDNPRRPMEDPIYADVSTVRFSLCL